jgi:hypothetical protein
VRLQAAKGLEKLDDPVALPTLSSTAGADASRPVREAAASAAASISRVAGSPLPAQWHFDRVVDRVVVEREGECALTRTMTLRIDSAPEPVKELAIVLPDAFPQVSSVVGAGGDPLAFKLEWQGERRHAVFNVPSIGTGEATSFTLSARSRRPVFRSGASEILVEYAPAPMQARVDALSVELVLPGGGRAIAPAGLRVDKRADGEVIALERSAVSPRELDSLLLRAAAPTASFKLPYSPPRSYARAGDLATAACVVAVILASLTALIVSFRRTMGERADRAVVVAVLTAGAVVFLTPMIFEDNLAYYSLARSAVLDGDLDSIRCSARCSKCPSSPEPTRSRWPRMPSRPPTRRTAFPSLTSSSWRPGTSSPC